MKMDSRYRDGLKSGQRRICWVRYASGTRDGFSRLRGHVSVHRPVDHALLKKDCLQIYQPLCFRRNVKGNTSSLSIGSFMSSIFWKSLSNDGMQHCRAFQAFPCLSTKIVFFSGNSTDPLGAKINYCSLYSLKSSWKGTSNVSSCRLYIRKEN